MARKNRFGYKRQFTSPRRPLGRRRRAADGLRASSLGVEWLEERAMLAAGSLDTTFNPGGAVPGTLISSLGFVETGQAVAVQADGKILIAGSIESIAGGATTRNFGVARFNVNGSLDTTFGTTDLDGVNGLATVDFFGRQDTGFDLILDPSGKILLVGQAASAADDTMIGVARLTTSGALDPSFDTDGKASLLIAGFVVEPRAGALQNDGSVVVVGPARSGGSSTNNFLVARFNSSGGLDTAGFGGGAGYVMQDFDGRRDEANDVAIQSDQKIVVGGFTTDTSNVGRFGMARFNTDGTLDTGSFGVSGLVRTDITGLITSDPDTDVIESIVIQPGGKIVVAGHTDSVSASDAVVARYNTSGTLDTATFNSGGSQPGTIRINTAAFESADGLARQPNGDYVVAGRSIDGSNNESLMVFRVLASTGQLDASFGSSGITLTNLAAGTVAERHRDVAMAPDGKIVAGGQYNSGSSSDFVLARYESGLVTATIAGAATVNEGDTYTLTTTSPDPTTTQWVITWGDGNIQTVLGNPPSVPHTYADGPNNYTISATVTTSSGTSPASNTVAVTVNNVAPTVAINGAATVNEGALYTLNLSATGDPGTDAITSWMITWGDGPAEFVSGNPSSVTHTYADGPTGYTISATATDEDGTYNSNSIGVTVNNVAPMVAISGAATVNEGALYTLNLSVSGDPGTDAITSWMITWGDGPAEFVSGNPSSVTHTYADGNISSNYVITATATDEDGTYAAGNTVAVTVVNVAPTANAGGPYTTFDDTPILLTGTATDPAGAADPLTYLWDLDGDNIFGETGGGATRGDEVGASVTYNPTGLPASTLTVKLRVNDGDGGITTVTTTVQVIGVGTTLIGGVLYIVGTDGCDIAMINKCNNSIMVVATFNANNPMLFNESAVTDIQVIMRGGHDLVVTTPNVNKTMTIDGGSGHDLLTGGSGRNLILGGTGNDILHGANGDDVLLGGSGHDDLFGGDGNDVLVGGDGNDILHGGNGRDLLIGSQDEDKLQGGNDDDILIGGYTIHDSNVSALDAIMAIWGSAASFSARVATLTGSGGLLQAGVTVFDDDDCDQLTGNAGRDLYFGDNNPSDGVMDSISLQALQDQLIAVT